MKLNVRVCCSAKDAYHNCLAYPVVASIIEGFLEAIAAAVAVAVIAVVAAAAASIAVPVVAMPVSPLGFECYAFFAG